MLENLTLRVSLMTFILQPVGYALNRVGFKFKNIK